ncbi:hypothetical protein MCHI_001489 [Candidatus Magnetoovum chiemensis]|nr:hypothetical protein MCHI_001489 [Candidatus Magnetoovum chiemensis]
MSQLYDITLKKTIKNIPKRFLRIFTGFEEGRFLDTQFPTVQNRRPDIVIELPDNSIYHFELEAKNEKDMEWRVHDYYSLIYQEFRRKTRQIVLYVGEEPLRMKDRIHHDTLLFSYTIKDIRDINCSQLLESNNPDDALLSILCQMDDPAATLRAIRERFTVLPEKEQKDYIVGLKNLARLRGLTALVIKEVEKKMPITIDISMDEAYLQGREEGLLEGQQKGLLEGQQKGLIEGIELAITIKFGASGLIAMDKIKNIIDINKLEQIKYDILRASDIVEFVKLIERI